jgi:hypothetical protein
MIAGLVVSASGNAIITQPVLDVLTQADALPSSDQLTSVHGSAQQALDNLRAIALSESPAEGRPTG